MKTATLRSRTRVARGGVLVLGGGFAGTHVARGLGSSGTTIVESRPMAVPLRTLCPDSDLVSGSAVALDTERRLMHVQRNAGRLAIAYAELVVALGPASPVVKSLGLPTDEYGLVRVDEKLRVTGVPHVWALGDCAAVPNEATPGETDPATSEHALHQAYQLARNLRGTPAPYRYAADLPAVHTPGRD
jgi:NADH dehydrogenase FAD-containing subunit